MAKLKDVIGGSGLEEGLEKAKELLREVKATLKDAEMRHIREEGVLLWLHHLRNLALEIEDLDDVFQYQVLDMEAEGSMEVVPVERAAASSSSRNRKERYSHSDDEDEVRLSHASSSPPVLDSFRKDMEDRLNNIQERYKEIITKKALCLPNISGQPSQYGDADGSSKDRRTGSSMVNPKKFIGRDEEKKEILDMLISAGDANPNAEVIALVGMGGIGKTTLCQHIYNDSEVRKHFDLMGWIHVGESLDVLAVTNNILNSFTKGNGKYDELSIVQEKIMEQVQGKRFLLIMDDVWCEIEGDWEKVLAPLLNNEHVKGRCKILVTTRHNEVAHAAGVLNPIQLNRLSPEDGWCLFRNYACNRVLDGHDDSHELVDIGKEIVAKCDGLPLAIKVMGSLMRNRGDDVDSWREIRDSDFSNIKEGRREILGPLYLSYLHLPSNLKACFKFFSLIPDREKWSLEEFTRKLIDLWLAHDFVGNEGNCSFLEQGIKLIGEFQSRSFIQRPPEEILDPRVGNCVHDLIFDLSQFVLDPSEIDKTDHCKLNKSSTPPTDARNLTIFTPNEINTPFKPHVLPTIELKYHQANCSPSSDFYPKLRYLQVGLANIQQFQFKHLRVLCIEFSSMEEIPDSLYKLFNLRKLVLYCCDGIRRVSDLIGNLKNLRSLSFSCCWNLEMIPESVSKLTALEELKLNFCLGITELPDGITRLANLRCLDVKETKIHCLPVGVSNLRKLRYLPHYPFPPGEYRDGLNYLNRLNLKGDTLSIKLDISSLQVQESKKDQMGIQIRELRNLWIRFHPSIGDIHAPKEEEMLEHLKPNSDIREIHIHGYNGCYRLPLWMGDRSFHQLVSIQLEEFTWCKTLSPLQQLPSLEMLSIRGFRCLEKLVSDEDWGLIRIGNIPCSEQKLCFPKLEYLVIEYCRSMRFLHVYQFASLESLAIRGCVNLESIEFVDNSSSTEEHHDRRGNPSLLLRGISLINCPKLCFSSNNNVIPPQSLKNIRIDGCQKLADWCGSNPNSMWRDIIQD